MKKLFAKIVNCFQQSTIFAESSILDWQGAAYAFVKDQHLSLQQIIVANRKEFEENAKAKEWNHLFNPLNACVALI